MIDERTKAADFCAAQLITSGRLAERARPTGIFTAECFDAMGNLKWEERFPNTVMIEGENYILDTGFGGVAYTATGPFIGLIAEAGFASISTNNTMASHAGWLEAGLAHQPTYSGNRKTAAFSAAAGGVKTLSAVLPFTFTNVVAATVKGAFLCFGAGASATKDTTTGKLWSAGLFASGDREVIDTDILNISYQTSLATA